MLSARGHEDNDVQDDESTHRAHRSLFFDPKEAPLVAVSGNYDNVVLLRLDTGEKTVIETVDNGFDLMLCQLEGCGHRDGVLAVGGYVDVYFIDLLNRRKAKGLLVGHENAVNVVVEVPSDSGEDLLLATASDDNTVRVWSTSERKQLASFDVSSSSAVRGMCCLPSRKWLVSGPSKGLIEAWDCETLRPVVGWIMPKPAPDPRSSTFSGINVMIHGNMPTDECFIAGRYSMVNVFSLQDGPKCVRSFKAAECYCLLQHPTKEFCFFSGHYNGSVLLWDHRKEGTFITSRRIHGDIVHGICHVGGRRFASCSWDETVRVWTSGETEGSRNDGEEKTRKFHTDDEKNHALCCVVPFFREPDAQAALEERIWFLLEVPSCSSSSSGVSAVWSALRGVSGVSGSTVRIFRFFVE